jgi:hypothetical protein
LDSLVAEFRGSGLDIYEVYQPAGRCLLGGQVFVVSNALNSSLYVSDTAPDDESAAQLNPEAQ